VKSANAHSASTILAFDFGTQHIGVAVGDTETRIAHALGVVEGAGSAARMADAELDRLIELQRKTLDKEKRRTVMRQIQEYLLDKMYVVPTVEFGFFWINHPYLHDLVSSRSTTVQLYRAADLWLDERAPKRTLP